MNMTPSLLLCSVQSASRTHALARIMHHAVAHRRHRSQRVCIQSCVALLDLACLALALWERAHATGMIRTDQ